MGWIKTAPAKSARAAAVMTDAATTTATTARVEADLRKHGYSIVRQLLPETAINRARAHLEKCVDKHLAAEVEAGRLSDACAGLPLEERMARAYAHDPEAAPCSWVPQTKHAFAFQQLLFRDPTLCALVSDLTGGRPAEVASRYNCRCKLPDAAGAAFPWHQDHAFFRMQYLLKKQEPKRLLAAWAPLVVVDAANGGVEYAAGSHAGGFRKHHRAGGFLTVTEGERLSWSGEPPAEAKETSLQNGRSNGCNGSSSNGNGAPPPQQHTGSVSDIYGVVPTLYPGDVIFFTDLTMHRSGLNTSKAARWSADWAYELKEEDGICPPLAVEAQEEAQVEAAASHEEASAAGKPVASDRRRALLLLLGVAGAAVAALMLARRRRA